MITQRDEEALIEFVLGRCDDQTALAVRERLAADGEFAAECEALRRTLSVLAAHPTCDPPEDLAGRTMARVRASRRTEALLESQRAAPRRRFAPTFSLRDLVAIAAVLVLAAGILFPSLRQARRRADASLCANNMGQIGAALSSFADVNNDALPAYLGAADSWLPSCGPACASNSEGLFLLIRHEYARPGLFQCPAAGGEPFVAAAGMTDFPSPLSISYSYQYSLGSPLRRGNYPPAQSRQMAILADATPAFVGGVFRPDCASGSSQNHGDDGQNTLYLDWHVARTTGADVGVDGDNIWLVKSVASYTGRERPASVFDSFLLPSGVR